MLYLLMMNETIFFGAIVYRVPDLVIYLKKIVSTDRIYLKNGLCEVFEDKL